MVSRSVEVSIEFAKEVWRRRNLGAVDVSRTAESLGSWVCPLEELWRALRLLWRVQAEEVPRRKHFRSNCTLEASSSLSVNGLDSRQFPVIDSLVIRCALIFAVFLQHSRCDG